ncbi:MAG TPA: DUF4383 domain-containing protein [Longimicrobiales bacterium]
MTAVQRVAQIIGWIFIIAGVIGFFDTGFGMEADMAMADRLLGIFPVNFLHNLVHLGSGIWGVWAASRFDRARSYARILGVVYLVLVVLAFFTPTFFGLMPIGGNDIWLHLLLAIPLLYFGFTARERPRERAEG